MKELDIVRHCLGNSRIYGMSVFQTTGHDLHKSKTRYKFSASRLALKNETEQNERGRRPTLMNVNSYKIRESACTTCLLFSFHSWDSEAERFGQEIRSIKI